MRETYANICDEGKIIKAVAPLYAGKNSLLTVVLQYVFQVIRLSGSGREEEACALESILSEKLVDFEKLGARIEKLGATPVFTACPPYPVSYHSAAHVDYAKPYPLMLAADIRLEQKLAEAFGEAISAVEDREVIEVLNLLRESSRRHLARLQTLLEYA